ncbi:hypothetical protein D3C80_944160 [compost metagenome]
MPDGASRILRHLLDQARIADSGLLTVTLANHTTEFFCRHRGLANMRNTFSLVGIQERRGSQASFHQREFPDQIQGISDPLAHALCQERRCHVR